ncbi:MAG TPA: ABC transporter permease subunit [Caulobacteraceae bacterium]|nr:ABC transporter permease subunit [Caulobacteraceae bacterium]
MVFLQPRGRFTVNPTLAALGRAYLPNGFDILAFCLIAGVGVMIAHGGHEMDRPLSALNAGMTLDLKQLPGYAVLTTLRMFAALGASLIFTFVVATLAAKSRKAELVIVPALDILQSVPVLGFLTFTITFFMNLFPARELGLECASIFAIFTAQAWNMTFSMYQSLRTLPGDLEEVSQMYGLSPWRRFWRLDLPFAMPGLIWNMMMSMSGAWFFVVASEAITVKGQTVALPGIGSWLSMAIEQRNFGAVAWAVGAMVVVILLYDQLLFRPIVAWADKFRFELTASESQPTSWLYDALRRTRLFRRLRESGERLIWRLQSLEKPSAPRPPSFRIDPKVDRAVDRLWLAVVILAAAGGAWEVFLYIQAHLHWSDVFTAVGLGFLTLIRVLVLIFLASLVWTPIGVWIGLRPAWAEKVQAIAQILAAFPANVLFPFAVIAIVAWKLDPNIWLSPLMVLGTQWYILFNVIAGASALPGDLREAAKVYKVKSWAWWRDFAIPGIFPYYVTGALTASGGSWNASIVAEVASWGKTQVQAAGLGAYIANATAAGDFPRVVTGVAVMSIFVIALNRSLWRPLYVLAERRFRLN